MTTGAKTAPEFKEGDSVTIKAGVHSGKSGKVTKVLPTQNTNRGVEGRYLYKTSSSSEYYRAQDLQKG